MEKKKQSGCRHRCEDPGSKAERRPVAVGTSGFSPNLRLHIFKNMFLFIFSYLFCPILKSIEFGIGKTRI